MAHNIQYPDRPGEVALVIRGEEGAGKGTIVKQLGRIFGVHYLHVWQAKHLVGNFNAHLQHCSCLYADEAFYAGDRQHESTLKALITEPTLMVEPKGLNPYQVRNCIHLYMTSNSDWVVPAGAMARRFLVLDALKDKFAIMNISAGWLKKWIMVGVKPSSIFFSAATFLSSTSETFR
jgi:hypothetical protein